MKKMSVAGMLVCAAAIFYSCSSPAYVEKDSSTNLSNYRTYMWVDVKASEIFLKNQETLLHKHLN